MLLDISTMRKDRFQKYDLTARDIFDEKCCVEKYQCFKLQASRNKMEEKLKSELKKMKEKNDLDHVDQVTSKTKESVICDVQNSQKSTYKKSFD